MLQGTVRVNDVVMLGPDKQGDFIPTTVKSICRRRLPALEVRGGQTATFALKKVKRTAIRKGMVLVAPALKPVSTFEFEADIIVLHHPTTMTSKYQAMVHCGTVRQTACILHMDADHLRSGDHTSVVFRFMQHPEYMRVGSKIIFRDGRTKAVGTVTKVLPPVSSSETHSAARAHTTATTAGGATSLTPASTAAPLSNRQSRKLFYDALHRTRESAAVA